MKKIFALALAAVMTAGMATVAFADVDEVYAVVGIDGAGNSVKANEFLYVLNGDGKATTVYDVNKDVQIEGGDKLAIPLAIYKDGDGDDAFTTGEHVSWYSLKNQFDYDKSQRAYADWDDGDADVETLNW